MTVAASWALVAAGGWLLGIHRWCPQAGCGRLLGIHRWCPQAGCGRLLGIHRWCPQAGCGRLIPTALTSGNSVRWARASRTDKEQTDD